MDAFPSLLRLEGSDPTVLMAGVDLGGHGCVSSQEYPSPLLDTLQVLPCVYALHYMLATRPVQASAYVRAHRFALCANLFYL